MPRGEVSVTVLGCGDAFGSGGRLHTSFFVRAPSAHFLIDCGASALVAMKRYGVDPTSIETVVVSHLHGDHFGGLPFLIRETQIAARRTAPLVVVGPRGVRGRVEAAMEVLFPGSAGPQTFSLDFLEYAEDRPLRVGPLSVAAFPVIHTADTEPHAVRVECDGAAIAYSGDTEWTPALRRAADGADLFICEAYSFDRRVRNHLSYRELMEHAPELGCRRILLTHLGEEMLSMRESARHPVAEDGMVLRWALGPG